MLDIFKENLKKEIDTKIQETKDAWENLSLEKLTDGQSNSQADAEYSKNTLTPKNTFFQNHATFYNEPDIKLDVDQIEDYGGKMSSKRVSKDDT